MLNTSWLHCSLQRRLLQVGLIGLLFAMAAQARTFDPDNILVSSDNTIYEVTKAGVLVDSFPVDNVGSEVARDLVIDEDGLLHVFNGTLFPKLSTYDPDTETWEHNTFAGWSTANQYSYGGIATYGQYIFVTDMETLGSGEPSGIVRFDKSDGYSAVRFSVGQGYIDLNIGLDGNLYALQVGEHDTDVFDPVTMVYDKTVFIESFVRGVSVNHIGQYLGVSLDGTMHRFSPLGFGEASLPSQLNNPTEIDVNGAGLVMVGSINGGVVFADETMNSRHGGFLIGTAEPSFVAFVDRIVFSDNFEYGDTRRWSLRVSD
ncbi:MAG: hypothetical protein AAF604_21480 [Acidobacteriota bacterium]